MGLGIYIAPELDAEITSTTPLSFTFNGIDGGIQDKCVYLRNNDASRWFENIALTVVDTLGDNLVDGSTPGYSWKLMEKDTLPAFEEWGTIAPGASLNLSEGLGTSSLADIITFLPIWVRVEIPRGAAAQTIIDVVLRLTAREHLI